MFKHFSTSLSKIAITGIFASALFLCPDASAIPARQHPYTITQPDGTQLTVTMVGDERGSFLVDQSGRLVCKNENGAYYFGNIDNNGIVKCSEIQAIPDGMATNGSDLSRFNASVLIPKALQMRAEAGTMRINKATRIAAAGKWNTTDCKDPNFRMLFTDFPTTGKINGLVILVEFSDKKFTQENPKEYFSRMLNEEGFSENGCVGSARDYFIKSSSGQFIPEFDVYGPVDLGKSYSYYGKNNSSGSDMRPEQMIIDACTMMDDEINFTKYDLNGDKKVDCVYVFYAGFGEADNPQTTEYSNTIWPHQWDVYSATRKECIVDGMLIDHYACSNELRGVYATKPKATVGIGSFVHEFSHVMGIPDLYTTVYNNAYTPGSWTTLDRGSYNGDGCVPPLYSSFERFSLGWIKPKEFSETKEYTINELGESNEAYIAYTEKPTEFFLFENRQRTGFDSMLSGHGMLVWHIDFNQNIWNRNSINNTVDHQYVDLIEASGISTLLNQYLPERQRPAESFPGVNKVTEFNSEKLPKFVSWAGKPTDISLSEIAENDGIITLKATNMNDAGISGIDNDGNAFRVWTSGSTVATDAEKATVYDSMGRLCGHIGEGKTLEAATGIYIVAANGKTVKIFVK